MDDADVWCLAVACFFAGAELETLTTQFSVEVLCFFLVHSFCAIFFMLCVRKIYQNG